MTAEPHFSLGKNIEKAFRAEVDTYWLKDKIYILIRIVYQDKPMRKQSFEFSLDTFFSFLSNNQ